MSAVSEALREVSQALRHQGGFNDKAVDRAFAAMATQLEARACALESSVAEVGHDRHDVEYVEVPEAKVVEAAPETPKGKK